MYILIWILFIALILILVAISEREIAKQDAEWMKEEEKKWKEK
jgi:preprotein translocase subunit SecG